jgi:hypothetical protein
MTARRNRTHQRASLSHTEAIPRHAVSRIRHVLICCQLPGSADGGKYGKHHTDAHAGIVNVPGLRAIVDALAGEDGHTGKNALGWLASASRHRRAGPRPI